MDTATLSALWRQCAPPTRPWHSDAGESAMLHLRVAHYLRHLTLQLHTVLRDKARVRWETYDHEHAAGHVGLCGISILPNRDQERPVTLEWAWNANEQYGVVRCPQLNLSTQPIIQGMRDTDIDRSLLTILPSLFAFLHGIVDTSGSMEAIAAGTKVTEAAVGGVQAQA